MSNWWQAPTAISTALFAIGWFAGWVGFVRARRLETVHIDTASTTTAPRPPVSLIIPCRDEAENLAVLLPQLHTLLDEQDEVIVVDDASTDSTAAVARDCKVHVVHVDALPAGWAGKSHACWLGARQARNDVLLFLDADVRLGASAIDALVAQLQLHPDALVSAMPWHRTKTILERLSMMFNIISSMVASITTPGESRRVAYGPCMIVSRSAYRQYGGHSHPVVRAAVVEDLALARVMPSAVALVARHTEVEYRMYPLGLHQLLEGWTKNTAIGAGTVPRAASVFIIFWVVSLCGGALTSVWFYVLSVVQVLVFARRVGNFGIGSAITYPLHAAVFVMVALRSLVRVTLFGSVAWRGRRISTR